MHYYIVILGAPVGVITATVSQLSKPLVLDDTGDDTDPETRSDSATPLFTQTWRHHPHVKVPKEVLIIGSFGDCVNLEQQLVGGIIEYIIICNLDILHCKRYFQLISLMNGEGKKLKKLQTFTKKILNAIIFN